MMRSRHIPSPFGSDAETDFHRTQARRAGTELRPKSTPNAKFQQTTQGFSVKVKPPAPSVGGAEIELTDCATGKTYLVRGRLKPEEDEEV